MRVTFVKRSLDVSPHRDISSGAPTKVNHVPLADQQTALALLLELAVQRGSLSHILQVVLLLLKLWRSSRHQYDNRFTSSLTCAPLAPLLRRFEQIEGLKKASEGCKWDEVSGSGSSKGWGQCCAYIFRSLKTF